MNNALQHLTTQENDLMNYFWAEDKPLTLNHLSELCGGTIEHHHLNVVIKKLINKNHLEVTGKIVNSRLYYRTVSFEDYISNQLTNIMANNKNTFNIGDLLRNLTKANDQIVNNDDLKNWLEEEKAKLN